jgi:hypothetical protein
MNEAATQDLRSAVVEPVLAEMLHGGRAPSGRDAEMLSLLDAWRAHGSSRLDRTGNGEITDPGAAIMDTAWPLIAKAWASSVLKDLRTILGEPVKGKYAVRYCGAGNVKRCRALIWGAINTAGNQLAAQQGPNPADWHASATAEEITFTPRLLPYKMAYTNRPSGIQQVISFGGHAPQDTGR